MFAKTISRLAAGAVIALALGATSAFAQAPEVSAVKVTPGSATSVRINVAGLPRSAVRRLVGDAAAQVCSAAIDQRQLYFYEAEWCVGATQERAMADYRQLTAAHPRQLAAESQTLTVALN